MHYFQAHSITVYTKFPLKNILSKVDLFGWLSKWVVELGQLDIKFLPRAAIKWQVLVNFVAEFFLRTVSLEQDSLASVHKWNESPEGKSIEFQPIPEDHEVIREPP